MEAYSLNPQILPGQPLTQKEHHRAMTWLIIMIAIIAIGGVFFWLSKTSRSSVPLDNEDELRGQVLSVLREASVQPSEQEVQQVTSLLSKAKEPSNAERSSVINLLKRK